jgi:hypothetical protein
MKEKKFHFKFLDSIILILLHNYQRHFKYYYIIQFVVIIVTVL